MAYTPALEAQVRLRSYEAKPAAVYSPEASEWRAIRDVSYERTANAIDQSAERRRREPLAMKWIAKRKTPSGTTRAGSADGRSGHIQKAFFGGSSPKRK